MKYYFIKIISFAISAFATVLCQADVDSIQRHIWSDGNVVWVEDDLHFSEEMAEMHGFFWQIYADAREGGSAKTNLQQHVMHLLEDENLAMHHCDALFTNGCANVHIVSVVNFGDDKKPAILHIVSSLGGETVRVNEVVQHPEKIGQIDYFGRRVVNELLIYKFGQKYVLYFPNLGPAANEFTKFDDFTSQFDFASINHAEGLKNDQKYVCTIESSGSLNLLYWISGKINEHPTLSELRIMDQNSPMMENDLISLCSTMHIAKGGYYELSSDPSMK